jgi:hypothetical protein
MNSFTTGEGAVGVHFTSRICTTFASFIAFDSIHCEVSGKNRHAYRFTASLKRPHWEHIDIGTSRVST